MHKIYKTRVPVTMYVQIILFIFLTLMHTRLTLLSIDGPLLLIVANIVIVLMLTILSTIPLVKILKKNNILELTSNKIKMNNVEVEIQKIEKIIIQGYFIQSIGIKLYGKKYILNDLHFRFKHDEEKNIDELMKWAVNNGIAVTEGRIYRSI